MKTNINTSERMSDHDVFFRNSSDLMCVLNNDGTFVDLNHVWAQTFAQGDSLIKGSSVLNLVHPDDKSLVIRLLADGKNPTTSIPLSFRCRLKDNSYCNFIWRAFRRNGIISLIGQKSKQIDYGLYDIQFRDWVFRQIVFEGAVPIAMTDEKSNFIFANPAFESFTGYTRTELKDMTFRDITHQDHLAADIENIKKLVIGEISTYITEKRYLTKQGDTVWGLLTANILKDNVGKFLSVLVMITDITKEKHAEFKLLEEQQRLRALIENTNEAKWAVDTNYCLIAANSIFYQFANQVYHHSFEVGKSTLPDDRISAQTIQAFKGYFDQVIGSGKPLQVEIKNPINPTHYSGDEFVAQYNFFPIFSTVGNDRTVSGVVVRVSDITEHLKQEEKIREQELLLHNINNNLISGMIYQVIRTPDGRRKFMYLSDSVHKFYGCTPNEVMEDANLIYGKVHPEDRKRVFQEEEEANKKLITFKTQVRMITPSGDIRWSSFISSPRKLEDGSTCWDGIEFDITELIAAREEIISKNRQLEEINAEKDRFFTIIAHDLRSPFSVFLGVTEILANESVSLSQEEINSLTVNLYSSASNLYDLLNNLLTWARLERGLVSFIPKPVLLSQLIRKGTEIFIEKAKHKEISINISIHEDQPVFIDLDMMLSVMRNLVGNALKFTRRGGMVNISTSDKGENTIEIIVSDNGIGMSKEFINKLFGLTDDNRRSGTDGEESTGLGLLLCKKFVELNKGTIHVESTAENQNLSTTGRQSGSSFHFTVLKYKEI